jgi:hypothetical protein
MLTDDQVSKLLLIATTPDTEIGTPCPSCGHSNFSVRRKGGKLLWNCFRVSCGERGATFIPGLYSTPADAESTPGIPRLNTYTGDIAQLNEERVGSLAERFNLSGYVIRKHVFASAEYQRYVLPIYTPRGTNRGYVLRTPWGQGTELFSGQTWDTSRKSLTFQSEEGPLLSWYRAVSPFTVIVEDQISAIKANAAGYNSVALLGTSLNAEKVAEIQRYSPHVSIALDADATAQAFRHARKWQHAFESFRVVVLTKDLKDMKMEEVKDVLFRYSM